MKKHSLLVIILLVIVLLSLTTPVGAAGGRGRVGDRISLYLGNTEFPAGQPFYIAHGWYNPTNIAGVGLFTFSLEVDGVRIQEDFVERSAISGDPDALIWFWVNNFPEGMAGSHSFTGRWTGPCQGLVDMGVIPGPCEKTNEIVESNSLTIVVDFVP